MHSGNQKIRTIGPLREFFIMFVKSTPSSDFRIQLSKVVLFRKKNRISTEPKFRKKPGQICSASTLTDFAFWRNGQKTAFNRFGGFSLFPHLLSTRERPCWTRRDTNWTTKLPSRRKRWRRRFCVLTFLVFRAVALGAVKTFWAFSAGFNMTKVANKFLISSDLEIPITLSHAQ